jgi:hypothetical protein
MKNEKHAMKNEKWVRHARPHFSFFIACFSFFILLNRGTPLRHASRRA